jgi:hypothetical protein
MYGNNGSLFSDTLLTYVGNRKDTVIDTIISGTSSNIGLSVLATRNVKASSSSTVKMLYTIITGDSDGNN